MKKLTIAIDGHASTGKSSIAKKLAIKYGYIYINSGSMYRAVTLYAMQQGLISEDHFDMDKLKGALNDITLEFRKNESGKAEIYLNGENVERAIRTLEVSEFVSPVSTISEVRAKLVEQQQQLGKGKGVVKGHVHILDAHGVDRLG